MPHKVPCHPAAAAGCVWGTNQNWLVLTCTSATLLGVELPLAGYGRVSRVGDRDRERLLSPDQQQAAVARKARELGREMVWFGVEIDVSGSKVNRAVLDEIIVRIEAGELGGIIVPRLDRLARLKPRD